jgi:hypothetical protein
MRFGFSLRPVRRRPRAIDRVLASLARTEVLERRLMMHAGHHDEVPPATEDAHLHPVHVASHEADSGSHDDALHWDVPDFLHADPYVGPAYVTSPAPPPAPVTTIVNNGGIANRVDMVIVGDGYQSSQLSTYAAHASNVALNFFNQAPLSTYSRLFNIHRVDVFSPDSGVDNDPTLGVMKNTALDMHFYCSGLDRLLCIDTNKAQSYAINAPQVDHIIALANSTMYGGAGYWGAGLLTLAGGNGSSLEVARHEFGHSFAGLADEYGGVGTYSGGEPTEPNVSLQMGTSRTKWHRWLDLPEVDAFLGGRYFDAGIYRPTANSKMRSLGVPWGPVNTEQLILALYRRIDPIDAATPPGTYPSDAGFFVDPIDPNGHALTVQWSIDGAPIPGATGLTFDAGTLNLTVGNHSLGVRVVDATPMVRDEAQRTAIMTQTKSWTLTEQRVTSIVGRHVFYNNSAYDGFDGQPNSADDSAIADDKHAYFDGQRLAGAGPSVQALAGYSNYTSFTRGLNGVMVDVLGAPGRLADADFSFKMGFGGYVAEWPAAPDPTIHFRPGAGAGGADRYALLFQDGAVKNTWLQVTVNATSTSGLRSPDVFYFGNLVADTGLGREMTTTGIDVANTRTHLSSLAGLGSPYDHNRDAKVDLFDVLYARRSPFHWLIQIIPPAAPAPAARSDPKAALVPSGGAEGGDGASILTTLLLTSAHPLLDRAASTLLV